MMMQGEGGSGDGSGGGSYGDGSGVDARVVMMMTLVATMSVIRGDDRGSCGGYGNYSGDDGVGVALLMTVV